MKEFEELLAIAKRKSDFDQNNSWPNGSTTYLTEMKKEIDEVLETYRGNKGGLALISYIDGFYKTI